MAERRRFIGVATPQANPTVEQELHQLLPPPAQVLATRLVSTAAQAEDRLVEYMRQLPDALASFDTLPLELFLFGCTGSSYLVGPEVEDQITRDVEADTRIPIITATQAILAELRRRDVSRLAMLAPYPPWLIDAALRYWSLRGIAVTHSARIDVGVDTRAIYAITPDQALEAARAQDKNNAPVLLLSGTGMPTLEVIDQLNRPVLSSNLCLGLQAQRRLRRQDS
ncbi:MAG: hypothetical protein AB8B96_01235 [Lysobacterales bacterium]